MQDVHRLPKGLDPPSICVRSLFFIFLFYYY